MAGDWIRMRVWLARDPKVIWMADHLSGQQDFLDWLGIGGALRRVTRNVTRYICVTALLQVWGTAREQGRRSGDDLIIDCCDYSIIDEIAEVPCFGEAMGVVGWAEERENARLVLPKFFVDKESPAERHKSSNAERQAKYRANKRAKVTEGNVTSNVTSNVTRNVTVTPREEKSRVEELVTPPTPKGGGLFASEEEPQPTPKPKAPEVPIPPKLDTPAFDAAWQRWLAYRREIKRPLTERSLRALLARMEAWGASVAIQAIDDSIANGWRGIFEPKEGANGTTGKHGPGSDLGHPGRIRAAPGKYDHISRPLPAEAQ